MERPRSHEIDELAQRIFRAALPPSWVRNGLRRDYGKDYLLEIFRDNKPTGTQCFIQLKGQEKPRYSKDAKSIRFSLKTKHAATYVDHEKSLPVFLVVADVTTNKAYWQFLQPILRKMHGWRRRTTVTIQVDTANDVSVTAAFHAAIEDANRFIRGSHPTAIQDVIETAQREVSGLDPRLRVVLSIEDGKPVWSLNAKEAVSWKMQFDLKADGMKQRLKDLFDRGLRVVFKPGEVRVEGSPFFERLEKEGGQLQCAVNLPASVSLISTGTQEAFEIPGHIKGGRKEWRFDGGWEKSPLAFAISRFTGDERVGLSWNLPAWNGQPLRYLAFFDRLRSFIREVNRTGVFKYQCLLHGNAIENGELTLSDDESPKEMEGFLDWLSKARDLATHFKLNPAWTLSAMEKELRSPDVEELHAVLFQGEFKRPLPRARLEFQTTRKSASQHPKLPERTDFKVVRWYTLELFGETTQPYEIERIYAPVQAKLIDLRKKGRKLPNDPIRVVISGIPETVRTSRLPEPNS